MAQAITNAEKIRQLPWNLALNASNNVFGQLTFFGSSFILFLNALGSNNGQIGFLLSLLPFFGIIAVFIAPAVARFGYKRTFVTFYGLRTIIAGFLLLVPWVQSRFGSDAALTLVTLIVIGFALCRAIAETGIYPWAQEYIPNSIRGRHSAMNDMMMRISGALAIGLGGFILGLSTGINRFVILFGVGILFEAFAVWSATHLPGGEPTEADSSSHRNYLDVLRDRHFVQYMTGMALVIIGSAPLSFLPLFMQEEIGLSDSAIVWLPIGSIVGGFSATYLLGWAADRYGSKPVLLSGLYLKALLPIGWLLMPRFSPWSLPIALLIAFISGMADIAWGIGSGRLLYVKIVPFARKTEYMAMFYAAIGIIGGTSQILVGYALDLTSQFSASNADAFFIPIDPFTPLFLASILLVGYSAFLYSRIQADSDVTLGTFAGLFTHGNPVLALESLVRYYRAADERATVVVTERMGQTKSPLTVEELLEALKDPRFNVRFEAIISIARMDADPRLVKALCGILEGTELSTSVIAAWALGRMGDKTALPTLRDGLNSSYRSIQAHCARSLGTLEDHDSAPLMLERLKTETDKGLQIAYASAMGKLRVEAALDPLFELMGSITNEGARMELALSIARILDDEPYFIRLLRNLRADPGTTASQELAAWKRKTERTVSPQIRILAEDAADYFARDQLDDGAQRLSQINAHVTLANSRASTVLNRSAELLIQRGASQLEYVVLALVALHASDRINEHNQPERT
jgi:MFS family permease